MIQVCLWLEILWRQVEMVFALYLESSMHHASLQRPRSLRHGGVKVVSSLCSQYEILSS